MKTWKMMLTLAAAVVTAVGCGTKEKEEAQKVLVVYYSQTGNTKAVAEEIATKVGADRKSVV